MDVIMKGGQAVLGSLGDLMDSLRDEHQAELRACDFAREMHSTVLVLADLLMLFSFVFHPVLGAAVSICVPVCFLFAVGMRLPIGQRERILTNTWPELMPRALLFACMNGLTWAMQDFMHKGAGPNPRYGAMHKYDHPQVFLACELVLQAVGTALFIICTLSRRFNYPLPGNPTVKDPTNAWIANLVKGKVPCDDEDDCTSCFWRAFYMLAGSPLNFVYITVCQVFEWTLKKCMDKAGLRSAKPITGFLGLKEHIMHLNTLVLLGRWAVALTNSSEWAAEIACMAYASPLTLSNWFALTMRSTVQFIRARQSGQGQVNRIAYTLREESPYVNACSLATFTFHCVLYAYVVVHARGMRNNLFLSMFTWMVVAWMFPYFDARLIVWLHAARMAGVQVRKNGKGGRNKRKNEDSISTRYVPYMLSSSVAREAWATAAAFFNQTPLLLKEIIANIRKLIRMAKSGPEAT